MGRVRSSLLAAFLLVGCSSGLQVIDGHGIGPAIACPAVACDVAIAAVGRAVSRPISSVEWHEEVYLDRNGSPIIIRVGGLSRPIGVAVVTLVDGGVTAVSVACGPIDCEATR